MRGMAEKQMTMLLLVSPEQRIPHDHPIRTIKALVDRELARLSPVFDRMYATTGRPSIPPEAVMNYPAASRGVSERVHPAYSAIIS